MMNREPATSRDITIEYFDRVRINLFVCDNKLIN